LPTSKGLPSSLIQLRAAVWTGDARDTRPNSDICGSAGTIKTPGALRARGVDVAMLTGDNKGTPERIAKSLGIDIVFADVLPGDKASNVKELHPQRTRIQHRRPAPSTIYTETERRNVLWWR